MKIKPHGAFYLIPIGSFVLGGIISIGIFISLVLSLVEGFHFIDSTTNASIIVESDSELMILLSPELVIETLQITTNSVVFQTVQGDYTVTVSTPVAIGDFYFEEIQGVTTYEMNGFTGAVNFIVEEGGTFTFQTDAPENIITVSELSGTEMVGKVFGAIAAGGIGFIISVVSFIIILIKRSTSKGQMQQYLAQQLQQSALAQSDEYSFDNEKVDSNREDTSDDNPYNDF